MIKGVFFLLILVAISTVLLVQVKAPPCPAQAAGSSLRGQATSLRAGPLGGSFAPLPASPPGAPAVPRLLPALPRLQLASAQLAPMAAFVPGAAGGGSASAVAV
jgi:hypothetical protein